MVVSLECFDYTLVLWLDMQCEVWCKIFDFNILEIIGDNMTREVVLKQKDFSALHPKLRIPSSYPFLIQYCCHPCLRIVSVVKTKLGACLLIEGSRRMCLFNNKRWSLFGTSCICHECIG
jgi:hypothetical protein